MNWYHEAEFSAFGKPMFSAKLPLPLALLLLSGLGLADSSTSPPTLARQSAPAPPINFLEGKAFAGELGVLGKPASTTDILRFDDGQFVSEECRRRCGYAAGDYWVRTDGEAHFVRAETLCQDSDAVIVWEGRVDGDEIEGTFTWTSKRWYWTFEKKFWFKGRLTEAAGTSD